MINDKVISRLLLTLLIIIFNLQCSTFNKSQLFVKEIKHALLRLQTTAVRHVPELRL